MVYLTHVHTDDSKWCPTAVSSKVKWSSFPNFQEQPEYTELIGLTELPLYPHKDMPITEVLISINEEKLRELMPKVNHNARTRTCPVAQCITPLLKKPWRVTVSPAWCNFEHEVSIDVIKENTLGTVLKAIPSLSFDTLIPVRDWIHAFDENTILDLKDREGDVFVQKFSDPEYVSKVYEAVGFLNASVFIPTHILKQQEG